MGQPSLSAVQARMARAALKLTMREVAALTGVSANTICSFELGKHPRRPPHIVRLVREGYERAGVRFSADGIAEVRQR
jgi:transcriptional regulator with XRE-family HTH domain